jgi:hypothetical protein
MSMPSSVRTCSIYDDLLLYWAQTLSAPGLADEIGDRFDHEVRHAHQGILERLEVGRRPPKP